MEGQPSILIVDDEPFNVDYLEQELEDLDCVTSSAKNGLEALDQVAAEPPDIILLDIMMPEMDGFEVLAHLQADEHLRHIPVIVISALDDMGSIVRGIELGAEDYLPKPFDPVLLKARIGASVERKQLRDREVQYVRQINRELDVAWQIQAGLLPRDLPDLPGWQVAATLKPSRQTSGDFYDLIPLPDGHLGLLVADVVDKGMGAALCMVLSRTLIRTYARRHHPRPDAVLGAANRRILADLDLPGFVTVFFGILDPGTGSLAYSNAGHNPPYLHDARDGGTIQRLATTGPALGLLEDVAWGQRTVQMAPGDVLVLYSDGITEAQNEQKAFFGEERFRAVMRTTLNPPGSPARSAQDVQDAVLAEVQAFVGDAPQSDDITLMVVVRNAADPSPVNPGPVNPGHGSR
jgi:serine phosphatase RsbU (regulator of sigma subunit)